MADYVEKWGDSIDEAVNLALQDMKLTRDQVVVTVLEQPSRGFLGLFGTKLAKVRVEKKSDELKKLAEKAEKAEKVEAEKKERAERQPKREPKREVKREPKKETKAETPEKTAEKTAEKPSKPAKTEEPAKRHTKENKPEEKRTEEKKPSRERSRKGSRSSVMHTKFTVTADDTEAVPAQEEPAVKFIEEMAVNMGLNIEVNAYLKGDIIYINMEGKDVGTMIGKRGQTLDAVQYLASIVQNKETEKHIRVIINAEKYREKREKTLQQLARRLADKCVKSGKSIRLEPMNPYERKVIHSVLQTHPKVTTRSEGVEPNRRVIIELKK